MSARVVVGAGPLVELAAAAWGAPVERREATPGAGYAFDEACLDGIASDAQVFVAFDRRFLGHKRKELIGLARARGLRLATIVGPRAIVAADVALGANVFVGDGAIVGAGASIGDGAVVGPGAVLGQGVRVGAMTWIEAGALVADRALIGAHVAIGLGVTIAGGVEVGASCVVDVPGVYRRAIPAKTFYHPAFAEPIRVLG